MLEKLDFAKEKMVTYLGKACVYNVRKLGKLGYEIESLHCSIRILLENAISSSGRARRSEAAAHSLAN